MGNEFGYISFITFILSGLSYSGLAGYLIISRKFNRENLWLTSAVIVSAIWSFSTGLSFLNQDQVNYLLPFMEILRGVSWVVFLFVMLSRIWEMQGNNDLSKKLSHYLIVFVFLVILLGALGVGYLVDFIDIKLPIQSNIYIILCLCIIIFLLVENLYRNSAAEGLWGIRLLLFGVMALYIYDFLMFADILLYRSIGQKLFEARGMINFIVVPILTLSVIRNPTWKLNIKLSRKAAFHTITLIGTGAYLIGMSAAGYFLQNYGGKWGNILQATFILVALLGLLVFITSGRFRSLTQVLLAKHFFQYRYDYREEWLKFIQTISATGEHYDLRERVIKTLADVMDSSGGALWLREQPDVYTFAAKWNFQHNMDVELRSDDQFIKFLEQEEWIVDLNNDTKDDVIERHNITIPEWLLSNERFWLVLPLIHLGKLVGFVVLLQPRLKNTLNWESTDLLKTIGRQLASYLAEQIAEMALAEAREFESFNRKFAFVVHDIKNLASQLSLMIKNAEKYADNPEFQKDMVLTVQNSVEKMNNLLSRISVVQEPAKEKKDKTLNISRIMAKIVQKYKDQGLDINLNNSFADLDIYADEESIETVFMHLIENAKESCEDKDAKLNLDVSCDGNYVIIKVIDNGHGMDEDFIKNELFRPFRSTKKNGYGIGAYESREMIKRLGGKLDVKSKKNHGTTMKVYLRLAEDQNNYVN
ncbi:MAG: PEP-CTERM system histidine kinase PrsK [Emcibacter sp.]|nr:PEP-CTERM system histidine kinase PrsK [Emcibacter sp.]